MVNKWLKNTLILLLVIIFSRTSAISTMLPHFDKKQPPEQGWILRFHDTKTGEISGVYNDETNFVYADLANLVADADSENGPKAIFIHPIFKSQPKVWIVIQREFKMWFPGVAGAESDFLKNGDLYIVLTTDPKERYPVAKKTETLPIDYSVFNKAVEKPTCYALPEDHKLRPCTKEEAQLRSPALKVFLGES